eukprot:m51a1_g5576 hypothetical protein (484) ;mRNA; r:617402-619528
MGQRSSCYSCCLPQSTSVVVEAYVERKDVSQSRSSGVVAGTVAAEAVPSRPVVYDPSEGLLLLFRLSRGTILSRVWSPVLIATIIGVVVTALDAMDVIQLSTGSTYHTFIGLGLSLLLVFRTNSCYERWRDGRVLLAVLTTRARHFVLKFCTVVPDDELRERARSLITGFLASVKHDLRKEPGYSELERILPQSVFSYVVSQKLTSHPQALLQMLLLLVGQLNLEGVVADRYVGWLSDDISGMSDAWWNLVRIRDMPTPFAYAHHIKMVLSLYCFTAPFAMLVTMKLTTPFAALMLTYAFFGLDEIAVEIEEPFGRDPNDLPMDLIVETAEAQLREAVEHATGLGQAVRLWPERAQSDLPSQTDDIILPSPPGSWVENPTTLAEEMKAFEKIKRPRLSQPRKKRVGTPQRRTFMSRLDSALLGLRAEGCVPKTPTELSASFINEAKPAAEAKAEQAEPEQQEKKGEEAKQKTETCPGNSEQEQ